MHEPGSRETVIVQRGDAVFFCDTERHDLHTGDSVTFDADLPHHFENPGKEEAVLLGVLQRGTAPLMSHRHCWTRSGPPTRSRPGSSSSTCTSSTR